MKEKTTLALKVSLTCIVIAVCFSFNSSSLNEDTTRSLNELITQLDSLSDYTITLSGHTDNVGTDAYNEKLSESRAVAVKNYLVSKHVNSTKIKIEFYGEQHPMFPNISEENRAMNRRVEISVQGEKVIPEEKTTVETVIAEPTQPTSVKTPKEKEVKTAPVKTEVKKKKVRRRLVWTGWRTGFHWSTSGR